MLRLILLTGASGYLGRALLPALLAGPSPVVSAGRSATGHCPHRHLDLSGAADYREALEGVSTVIHCAGLAHGRGGVADCEKINVRASMALADAAVAAGARRLVLLSSLNIVPPGVDRADAPYHHYPEPEEAYAGSKWRCERVLEQMLAGTSCQLIILRPALVYDQELAANLATLARLASILPVSLPDAGCRSMVARPDLVRLIVRVVEDTVVGGAGVVRVAVTDGEVYSARRIGRALGVSSHLGLPQALWRGVSSLRDWSVGATPGSTWSSMASPHWIGSASRVDGWSPRWTLETLLDSGRDKTTVAREPR